MQNITKLRISNKKSSTYIARLGKDIRTNKYAYIMIMPVLLFYAVFHYAPMYGAAIAFKDFSPQLGIAGSEWVGLKHFYDFFNSVYFGRLLKNTLTISVSTLIFAFPAPILLALLINEIKNTKFKKLVQTVSYLPHFIALVIICGMIKDFTSDKGIINDIISAFGGERVSLLNLPGAFVPIYVISDIWQGVGWGSIVYLAALTGIEQELYEAASIDGANKWKKTICITIPGIMPTIIIMLTLRIGRLLSVGYEKVLLLYNSLTYDTADVISTYVYRRGLLDMDFSFSTAVGLFNSIVNFVLLIIANFINRKLTESSLW